MNFRILLFLLAGAGVVLASCRNFEGRDFEGSDVESTLSTQGQGDGHNYMKNVPAHSLPADSMSQVMAGNTGNSVPVHQSVRKARTGKALPETAIMDSAKASIDISPLRGVSANRIESYNRKQRELYPLIVRNPVLESYIWPFRKLVISLDNDMFSNTDRYYTNGVHIIYYSPSIAFFALNSLLPVRTRKSIEFNSLELHHAMYTPFSTKIPPVLKDDRPYASTLFVRLKRRSDTPLKRFSQSACIDIGVIGSAALGSYLQKGVHATLPTNDEPLGWETQIGNDIIFNYNYEITAQLVQQGIVSAYSFGAASAGSLNTSAEGGARLRISNDRSLILPMPREYDDFKKYVSGRWYFSFDSQISARVVGYNATLSGGLLNNNNYFVLMPGEIKRLVLNASAGISATYKGIGISAGQYYISKEFKEGKNHFWGQLAINIDL